MTLTDNPNPQHATWYEEGAASEDPPDDPTTPFPGLPPGVHPRDPSAATAADPLAAPYDLPGERAVERGRPPFPTENDAALPIFQRADHDWTGNRYQVDTNNAGTVQLCGRQKGRSSVTLVVPSAAAQGVVIGPTEDEVINNLSSPQLVPGQSLTLPTEAPVWAGVIPGQTSGTVDVYITFNPPGGALGAQ